MLLQIVKSDHAYKNDTEGQNSLSRTNFVLGLGKLMPKALAGFGIGGCAFRFLRIIDCTVFALFHPVRNFSADPTNGGGHDTLEPSHEERCWNRHRLIGHEELVEINHGDRNKPVGRHDTGNVRLFAGHAKQSTIVVVRHVGKFLSWQN